MASREEIIATISSLAQTVELSMSDLLSQIAEHQRRYDALVDASAAEATSLKATIADLTHSLEMKISDLAGLQGRYDSLKAEYDAHMALPHGPAPTPTFPPITVSLTATTPEGTFSEGYDFTKAVRMQPYRGTVRYELPLRDGLVFVVLDTPTKAHTSFAVERRKPGLFGPALPNVSYNISISDKRDGFSITQGVVNHGQWQRWRVQNKPWPMTARPKPNLVFEVDPRSKAPWMAAVPTWAPLFSGGLQKSTATGGLRPDIGPYTGWLAQAMRTGKFESAIRNAEAAASIPYHVRDEQGRMAFFAGRDNLDKRLQSYYVSAPVSGEKAVYTFVNGWKIDYAHIPSVAWAGFVFCADDPDPWWIEELQFQAAGAIGQAKFDYDRGRDGLFLVSRQVRDYSWGMVSFAHALAATPDDNMPEWLLSRSKLLEVWNANLDRALAVIDTPGFQYESTASFSKPGKADNAGVIDTLSTTSDYLPLAMLHCYRVTGDERCIRIGLAHLDRKIAARFRASPKYAALYHPAKISEADLSWRYFADWQEAYRLWGRESDETTPWASFGKPTGAELGRDGQPLMKYSDEYIGHWLTHADAYRASGFTTPTVDWLAGFLEAKRGNVIYEGFPQFAVKV